MRHLALFLLSAFWISGAFADEIRLAVTTSFQNSGLADILIPEIERDTGIKVHLLVVGTGQALRLGRAGDVDALLVHSPKAEERFITDGYGVHRREIMYNDYILVGPNEDPAGVGTAGDILGAMGMIAGVEAIFVSRGDDSGTHRRELELWDAAGIDVASADPAWYRAAGAGMGATLNIAAAMDAYVLVDRASWLNFANRAGLGIVFQDDQVQDGHRLLNQYAYLPVHPARHPAVRSEEAMRLERWLVSEKGQRMIGEYAVGEKILFVPNADREGTATDG